MTSSSCMMRHRGGHISLGSIIGVYIGFRMYIDDTQDFRLLPHTTTISS